jgi:hypothetical protein
MIHHTVNEYDPTPTLSSTRTRSPSRRTPHTPPSMRRVLEVAVSTTEGRAPERTSTAQPKSYSDLPSPTTRTEVASSSGTCTVARVPDGTVTLISTRLLCRRHCTLASPRGVRRYADPCSRARTAAGTGFTTNRRQPCTLALSPGNCSPESTPSPPIADAMYRFTPPPATRGNIDFAPVNKRVERSGNNGPN